MDKKINIAHVVCTYPPYRGGMGGVAYEYVERLRARGYNVHVFTIKDQEVEDDPRYVHRIPGVIHIGNASVLPSLFHRLSGFSLVHLHYPFFGGAEPVIVRKAMRADQGLVMTYHMDAAAGGVKGALFQAHRRLLFPWLVNRVDRILVSSLDYAKHSALEELSVSDRVEEHPFGVELDRFFPGDSSELREKYSISHSTPVILFVGGMDSAHAFKGIPELFQALHALRSYDWHAVLVGEGNLKESYKQQAKEMELDSRMTFAGNVSKEELPEHYRMADFHVFPSTKRAEAFGLVALEAAASGVPSIASDLPGVRTVVLDGDTGLLVPPGNVEKLQEAILLLLEQVDLRKKFGFSARVNAEHKYAWDPLIDRLEETYQSVLQQHTERDYKHRL